MNEWSNEETVEFVHRLITQLVDEMPHCIEGEYAQKMGGIVCREIARRLARVQDRDISGVVTSAQPSLSQPTAIQSHGETVNGVHMSNAAYLRLLLDSL